MLLLIFTPIKTKFLYTQHDDTLLTVLFVVLITAAPLQLSVVQQVTVSPLYVPGRQEAAHPKNVELMLLDTFRLKSFLILSLLKLI